MKSKLAFVIFIIFSLLKISEANFKVRAREHFDTFRVYSEDGTNNYYGLGPIINTWYEEPYNFSIGLSWGATFLWNQEDNSPLGSSVAIYEIGTEYKFFPNIINKNIFFRTGLSFCILNSDKNTNNLYGTSGYLGTGYEFDMGNYGLAIEAALRYYNFEKNIQIVSSSPSIGFHFYKSI